MKGCKNMSNKPILSVVVPTRGVFHKDWLPNLLKVKGNVEFIIVYPPESNVIDIDDERLKIITSPFKGEVAQRLLGLFNTSGEYVITMNEDQYLHPDIVDLTTKYFEKFPESWVCRIRKARTKQSEINEKKWDSVPDINTSKVCQYKKGEPADHNALIEVPIVPLDKVKFDIKFLFWPLNKRKDQHGVHMENFDQRIWKNEIVQNTIRDFAKTMTIIKAIKWVPVWVLDRLSLFLQAKNFVKGKIIGHWIPGSPQLLTVANPEELKESYRLHISTEILLVKRFPQYGYFWNLFMFSLWRMPSGILKVLLSKKKK